VEVDNLSVGVLLDQRFRGRFTNAFNPLKVSSSLPGLVISGPVNTTVGI